MKPCLRIFALCSVLTMPAMADGEKQPAVATAIVPETLIGLLTDAEQDIDESLRLLEQNWQPGMVPMVLESVRFARNPKLDASLWALLADKTGQSFGKDHNAWYHWWWAEDEQRHPNYAAFKSQLYRYLDPKFEYYFDDARESTVRLDEIRWGGVGQDGIPPLRAPQMIEASEADYLEDDHVIFGVSLNGDSRAYPKRILAWHEMFVDTIGGDEYAGVYCTLCGAVILYSTDHEGTRLELGTSGFLYRSNKVMYDKATQSLWSTTRGEPVVGPLVGKGIRLNRKAVVTSTWGEWRRRHPDTTVLSLKTGFSRDYGEGVAYRDYFATDRLMFTVPTSDTRLDNKAEVLVLQFTRQGDTPLAISAAFLTNNTLYHHELDGQELVVLTDPSGANRVYDATALRFETFDGDAEVIDEQGRRWHMGEEGLILDGEQTRARLPANRAFWFGWHAAHNDTELVK